MSTHDISSRDALAPEIAICDLGLFQILIPTEKQWFQQRQAQSRKNRWSLPKRRRVYRDRGWFFSQGQIMGNLTGLQFDPLVPPNSSQPKVKSLEVGHPISFEMSSQYVIPEAIAQRAAFRYQFNPDPTLHYALFQNLIPQFIRIYPLRSTASLNKLAQKFLLEKQTTFKAQ
jgi:hypothetical protein